MYVDRIIFIYLEWWNIDNWIIIGKSIRTINCTYNRNNVLTNSYYNNRFEISHMRMYVKKFIYNNTDICSVCVCVCVLKYIENISKNKNNRILFSTIDSIFFAILKLVFERIIINKIMPYVTVNRNQSRMIIHSCLVRVITRANGYLVLKGRFKHT